MVYHRLKSSLFVFSYISIFSHVISIKLNVEKETVFEAQHEIPNNVVCATSKVSDQPARLRSLIRAFASLLNIL